jgi:serine/threonine protein kinase
VHRIGYIHSDIRTGNMLEHDNIVFLIDFTSATQPNVPTRFQGCISTASNAILTNLIDDDEDSTIDKKILLYFVDDGISFLKCVLLVKNYFDFHAKIINGMLKSGLIIVQEILNTYEVAMMNFNYKNIIKTIVFLERNRLTLTFDALNDIMVHTLERENDDNYDISVFLKMFEFYL